LPEDHETEIVVIGAALDVRHERWIAVKREAERVTTN
jgi:hypothetical protein